MTLVLGIDTGGTYTDGVVVDPRTRQILCKAKAFTTRSDLAIGIADCLAQLDGALLSDTGLACLSTTLATNAIVEGRGGRAGLLVTGGTIDDKLPACVSLQLPGRLDIRGRVAEELDEAKVVAAVDELKRQRVDAVAVSGFASVRNPAHELRIKAIVQEHMRVPVVCAHELSSLLGFHERTVTAVLNARLIPIITDLIEATRAVLADIGVHAEIMVVKGDGGLMGAEPALSRPIETILSGPAASIIGGMFLSGVKDALIVDMGGTTTDIANLHQGAVKLRGSGARVGGWSTQIRAADVCTYGIGGDSYIKLDARGGIRVGPQKVKPLSLAGQAHPHLVDELDRMEFSPGREWFAEQETDCFAYVPPKRSVPLFGLDADVADCLRDGPHSAAWLAERLDRDVESLGLGRLVEAGLLERIALTPTDVLHVMGRYIVGDVRIVRSAVRILAAKAGLTAEALVERLHDCVCDELTLACLQSIVYFERRDFDIRDSRGARYFVEKALDPEKQALLSARFTVGKPIVAVGAPAHVWLEPVSRRLGARMVAPEHAAVANAVGAAVGQVLETAEALIRPGRKGKGFILYLPARSMDFETLQAAKAYALPQIKAHVVSLAKRSGSSHTHSFEHVEDIFVKSTQAGEPVYIETRIRATATGNPSWRSRLLGGDAVQEQPDSTSADGS